MKMQYVRWMNTAAKSMQEVFQTVAVSALLHARETTEKTNPRTNKIAEDADLRALD
jgi:hypothetical protein